MQSYCRRATIHTQTRSRLSLTVQSYCRSATIRTHTRSRLSPTVQSYCRPATIRTQTLIHDFRRQCNLTAVRLQYAHKHSFVNLSGNLTAIRTQTRSRLSLTVQSYCHPATIRTHTHSRLSLTVQSYCRPATIHTHSFTTFTDSAILLPSGYNTHTLITSAPNSVKH